MSTTLNPFDLLGEDDSDDISQLVAVVTQKTAAATETDKKEELPSKNQPGKDGRNESQGGGRGRGQGRRGGRGQGGRGYDRGFIDNVNSDSSYNGYSGGFDGAEGQDGGKVNDRRGGYGVGYGANNRGRRGGFSNGDGFTNGDASYDNERPARRTFERHSGSHSGAGRGNDVKREGSGRGNWGTTEDDIVVEPKELVSEWDQTVPTEPKELVNEWDKTVPTEKNSEETVQEDKKDAHTIESYENKELSDEQKQWIADRIAERLAEEKKKTLDEYEKELEEKRKSLPAVKSEERKVDVEAFNSMKLLSNKKKNDDEVFVKLGTDKDKRKEAVVADKAKKSVKTNEFLKLAEGVNSYRSGGRGGGRGRGGRGRSGFNDSNNVGAAPSITDVGQFPTLGGKE